MQYLIDVLEIDTKENGDPAPRQYWQSTHDTIEEGKAVYAKLAADRSILAACLCSWKSGSPGAGPRLEHGQYGARSTMGGVPEQRGIVTGHRSFWTNGVAGVNRKVVTLLDWEDIELHGYPLSTQPAPGFRLTPRPRTDEELDMMGHPWPERPGMFLAAWTNDCGLRSSRVLPRDALLDPLPGPVQEMRELVGIWRLLCAAYPGIN